MGDVEPATPGHQQLAPEAGHAVEHGHRQAILCHHLGGHEPGRTAADDSDAIRRRHLLIHTPLCTADERKGQTKQGKGKGFFFEKKKQKTFLYWAVLVSLSPAQLSK